MLGFGLFDFPKTLAGIAAAIIAMSTWRALRMNAAYRGSGRIEDFAVSNKRLFLNEPRG